MNLLFADLPAFQHTTGITREVLFLYSVKPGIFASIFS